METTAKRVGSLQSQKPAQVPDIWHTVQTCQLRLRVSYFRQHHKQTMTPESGVITANYHHRFSHLECIEKSKNNAGRSIGRGLRVAYDAAELVLHCMAQATARRRHYACSLMRPSSARLQASLHGLRVTKFH